MPEHVSVMPTEILEWINPVAGGKYLDATLGLGGHTFKILQQTEGQALVLGIDRDHNAMLKAKQRLSDYQDNIFYCNCAFSRFEQALEQIKWDSIDGAILDLGVSSLQLDNAERGFSFLLQGPLDMRMDTYSGYAPASQLVNKLGYEKLKSIIWQYGEEPMAGRIARAIINKREETPIETTLELAHIVEMAYPAKRRAQSRNHPATKTFQALRIAVNKELEELEIFLQKIIPFLSSGARIAVLSFHSLEDRKVKHFFKQESKGCLCPRHYPICQCEHEASLKILTKKPLTASEQEVLDNPRSRSAKLRVAEKI